MFVSHVFQLSLLKMVALFTCLLTLFCGIFFFLLETVELFKVKSFLMNPIFSKALNNKMKSLSGLHLIDFYILFVLSCIYVFVIGVVSANECAIDIRVSSSGNSSDCVDGDWDGFLSNNCCGNPFKAYLYGLAERVNKTGQIFLNSTEQNDCLSSSMGNAVDCGIQKLTYGVGGCSEYSFRDVVEKLGNRFNSLSQGCKMLGSNISGSSQLICNQCLKIWEENEPDDCSFAVLISVISQRIHDNQWFQAMYDCLGDKESADNNDQTNHVGKKKKSSLGIWILIAIAIAIAAGLSVIAIVGFSMYTSSSIIKVSSNFFFREPSSVNISMKEVHAATNNLSESHLIGQGIAGKVYKGILSDGQNIAVKHIMNDGHMDTFVREVKSLSHIKHPNLVSLVGHCDGNDECFLVYELCQNGNLSQWLYGKEKNLTWIQRLSIAVDCARGLSFLHTYPEGRIVHRDIKPTNILITGNFQGKLSDFGLSKVMNIGQSFVSSEVRGTFGYVDPEYQQNHHVNSSGDVYSFGIVLLQLLSGQKVLNMDSQMPILLNKLAKKLIRGGNLSEFADPKLNGDYSYEAFELIYNLALSCTGLKQQRPPMQQVVAKLEEALDISTRMDSFTPAFRTSSLQQ